MTLHQTLQALSDPIRRRILELLKKNDLPVSELAKNFDVALPTLSHHLTVLKNADLVTFQKRGQERIYSLNLSFFEEAAEALIKFFK